LKLPNDNGLASGKGKIYFCFASSVAECKKGQRGGTSDHYPKILGQMRGMSMSALNDKIRQNGG